MGHPGPALPKEVDDSKLFSDDQRTRMFEQPSVFCRDWSEKLTRSMPHTLGVEAPRALCRRHVVIVWVPRVDALVQRLASVSNLGQRSGEWSEVDHAVEPIGSSALCRPARPPSCRQRRRGACHRRSGRRTAAAAPNQPPGPGVMASRNRAKSPRWSGRRRMGERGTSENPEAAGRVGSSARAHALYLKLRIVAAVTTAAAPPSGEGREALPEHPAAAATASRKIQRIESLTPRR